MRAHPKTPFRFALAIVLVLSASGCSVLRTKSALQALNGASAPPDRRFEVSLQTRIARLAKEHLADAYFDSQRVAAWIGTLGSSPKPLETLTRCVVNAENDADKEDLCYASFMGDTANIVAASPREFSVLRTRENPGVTLEIDSQRFLGNARALGSSLAAMERMVGRGPLPTETLRAGVAEGAKRATAYVLNRRWRRSLERPTTAIVLSGGAANGAFSAGLLWRLLDVMETCRSVPATGGGCPGARIDLVAGTSTGALIGLVVDMAAAPGYEKKAREFLLDAYTCSTNSRLYCVKDEWIWKLATGDVKGLVRFDGVRQIIMDTIPEKAVRTNATERVSVSVDFQSGDIYAQSDQDPEDAGDWEHEVNGVLASVVEPIFAEPITELSRDGKPLPGMFLDGGVRSGLPLLEAVRRGAERVLVVNNSGIEPDRKGPQKNAFQILTRTIDLLSGQPRPGELQQGELTALARRWTEYNVCLDRLKTARGAEAKAVTTFCQRRNLWPTASTQAGDTPPTYVGAGILPMQAPPPTVTGPGYFRDVSASWRTSWVFRPERDLASAVGYEFDPNVMRPLFKLGVETFQSRCPEILSLLAIDGSVARAACEDSETAKAVSRAEAAFGSLAACSADVGKIRSCP